jgi:hypothetical protein
MGQLTEPIAERALMFGRDRHLLGVLSPPSVDQSNGIAFINSGIIHRVGANRIYVRLARALAARGAGTLRFDLSGIGDSGQPVDQAQMSRAEIEQRDIGDACSLMRNEGMDRLVVAGLCSGADHSLAAISRDERIAGAVLIDPFVFRTRQYFVQYYGPRLFRPAAWWSTIRGKSNVIRDAGAIVRAQFSRAARDESDSKLGGTGGAPTREEYAERLRALIGRRAKLLFVFTGGLEERYNYRDQLFDAFPKLDLRSHVELEYIPDADHTFSRAASQSRLEDRITKWYQTHFA